MNDIAQTGKIGDALKMQFKEKSLVQIFFATEIALILILIQRLYMHEFSQAAIVFSAAVLFVSSYVLAKRGKVIFGAAIFLLILTSLNTFLMWRYSGIRDETILAYPCILLMTALIGNQYIFAGILSFVSVSVLLNGIGNERQWYINKIEPITSESGVLVLLIILLSSYILWVLATEFYSILNKLNDENDKVIQANSEIKKYLFHDLITGLPNRMQAEVDFKKSIRQAQISSAKVGLAFIDIDNFKALNDSLGHQSGDELLKHFADRLQGYFTDNTTVYRVSGDEFLVLFPVLQSEDTIAMHFQNIQDDLDNRPFSVANNDCVTRCSIGIAVSPSDGVEFDDVVRHANSAMSHSKSLGGNCFHFFDGKVDIHGRDYIHIINDLRLALQNNELILHFQPKIDLITNKIIGAEALIRWQHPTKGLIYPDSFIPQAEKSGLIVKIGEWVLLESCLACQKWREQGFTDISIAVNISPQQFKRENITEIVQRALAVSKLPAHCLDLELTESLLIEKDGELKENIRFLNSLGVSFSIDDFGTGYSNLGYIQEFEVKSLKIDKSFIQVIEQKRQNQAIVVAIIQMAKSIGLITVAEGVEDKQTMDLLSSLGCDLAQGYYWSKPVPNEDFLKIVKDYI